MLGQGFVLSVEAIEPANPARAKMLRHRDMGNRLLAGRRHVAACDETKSLQRIHQGMVGNPSPASQRNILVEGADDEGRMVAVERF